MMHGHTNIKLTSKPTALNYTLKELWGLLVVIVCIYATNCKVMVDTRIKERKRKTFPYFCGQIMTQHFMILFE